MPYSIVNQLSVARAQGGTAFRITDEQWEALLAEAGGWPVKDTVDMVAAEIEDHVRGTSRGQGFLTDAVARRTVEFHAMDIAEQHFRELGWTVSRVFDRESYDRECARGDQVRRVEVKGTTGSAGAVTLTANAVQVARQNPGESVLTIVSRISLTRDADGGWQATGGGSEEASDLCHAPPGSKSSQAESEEGKENGCPLRWPLACGSELLQIL